MEKLIQAIGWYFAPGVLLARGRRKLPLRFVVLHTLPRILLFAALVWMLVIRDWTAAAIFGLLMIGLGIVHWLFGPWLMGRFGGNS